MSEPKIPEQTIGGLSEVGAERANQEAKWGQQDHDGPLYLTILTEEVGEVAKAILDHRYKKQPAAHIREELVQVAAVAVAMIEAYDRGNVR
jgi:NTP pyrophosphatase (non-canonical NTP hydrolase)